MFSHAQQEIRENGEEQIPLMIPAIREEENWQEELLGHLLHSDGEGHSRQITFVGVGNPVKGDDCVGLYIISKLRKNLGATPVSFVRLEPPDSSPEITFSKLAKRQVKVERAKKTIIIFDAVECNAPSGSIIFGNAGDTRYGFFATHNVPLKIIPSLAANISNVFVLGVQPENTDAGEENLSDKVRRSADLIVEKICRLIEAAGET